MTSWVSVTMLGFVLGMRHATDPDHVIAVTTIVARERSLASAALIGILWGIGHTATIVLVGGAIIVFGIVVPPRIGLTMEFSVAVMLVILGAANLAGLLPWTSRATPPEHDGMHAHPHQHGDFVHDHRHGHGVDGHGHGDGATPLASLDRRWRGLGLYQAVRPLIIGLVHGLAGSAAVTLLVLATIPDPWWGLVYLLVFGAGTIVGMMLITVANALPFAYTARRFGAMNGWLGVASGGLSLGFGLLLAYQIGFVDGLFTSHPHWTPQ